MRLALVLAIMCVLQAPSSSPITLRIRVFNGSDEVTAETRVTVFKAGERQGPVAEAHARASIETDVPPGIYDAQAIQERDGRAVNIRWAERLIVMPYPDENGQHLEVINFRNGFGAIEIRSHEAGVPDVAIFTAGTRQQEAGKRIDGANYALFVVKAGRYDLRVTRNGQFAWHPDIEVPADRTRLWVAPEPSGVAAIPDGDSGSARSRRRDGRSRDAAR